MVIRTDSQPAATAQGGSRDAPLARDPRVASACWSCGRAIDADDRYCRRCGQGQGAWLPWYYRPIWIVLLGLTVLGPFVLPLVWRSPRLGTTEKWIVSAIVLAVFAYVGVEFVVAFREFGRLLADV